MISEIDSKAALVVVEYVEACRLGDDDRLRAIFHPDALMSGYYQGELYCRTSQPFFDEVRDNPGPSRTGMAYSGELTRVEVVGHCASVTLKETGFLGGEFTDWFHLAEVEGQWLIVSKTYIDQI